MPEKYKVFISHASDDKWVALQMARHVRNCGAATFVDEEDIAHGDEFDEVIIRQVGLSSELVILFTPAARERKYVWLEIGMFLGARKRVIGVLYGVSKEEIATDKGMPVALKKLHFVDLNDVESYFSELRLRLRGAGELDE